MPNYGEPNIYLVYIDKFVTNVKLLNHLKKYGLGACNIAQAGSRFLVEPFIFCDVLSKKNNWGFLQAITVENSFFCIILKDFNIVQLMTTCHSPKKIHQI